MNEKISWSKKAMDAKTATGPDGTKVAKLLALGKAVVTNPEYRESSGSTHCNSAVCEVSCRYGYNGFVLSGPLATSPTRPMLANEMIVKMRLDSKNWSSATATEAWDHAQKGGLAVACYSAQPHGHVAVVAPGPRLWSQKWSAYVPQLFNVGPAKFMNLSAPYTVGENFAFALRPNHYVYMPKV